MFSVTGSDNRYIFTYVPRPAGVMNLTFDDSNALCLARGAHLASLTGDADITTLAALFTAK